MMDVAVSSYSPTLEALLRSRTRVPPAPEDEGIYRLPKILVVSQPDTPGQRAIPGTQLEAQYIQSIFPHSADILSQSQGTVDAVLSTMGAYDWVHFACHGVQNRKDPIASSLALYDDKLTLSMLMSKSLPHAELAYLSACGHTATEDKEHDAMHLAAAMLDVGFKSVIGSMWGIEDDAAPIVARRFYEVIRTQIEAGGELQPAYALHEATKLLRGTISVENFMQWVPFVHFGI